jgi:hypothetical protein
MPHGATLAITSHFILNIYTYPLHDRDLFIERASQQLSRKQPDLSVQIPHAASPFLDSKHLYTTQTRDNLSPNTLFAQNNITQ